MLLERGGGSIEINAILLGEALLHVLAISQYQLSLGNDGLSTHVMLPDTVQIA